MSCFSCVNAKLILLKFKRLCKSKNLFRILCVVYLVRFIFRALISEEGNSTRFPADEHFINLKIDKVYGNISSPEPDFEYWETERDVACDGQFIVYNKSFAVLENSIVVPDLFKAINFGGEPRNDVVLQPESREYFHLNRQ